MYNHIGNNVSINRNKENKMTNTKKNIEMHYQFTDIENTILNLEYKPTQNDKLEKEIKNIYRSIQNIKELIGNDQIVHSDIKIMGRR
jgi:hypothetical protein